MTVLVLGSPIDRHAQVVAEKIWARHGRAIFVDYEGGTQFHLLMDERRQAAIRVDGQDVGAVSRVWNRAKLIVELVATPEQKEEFLRRSEWGGAYRSIAAHFAGRVVNDPIAEARCGSKSEQQSLAASLGFLVPPTLITNEKAAALSFAEAQGELICKSVGYPQLPYNQTIGELGSVLTCAVTQDDIAGYAEEEFARGAMMLQRRIMKKWEYRVVAVAGRLFAFRLHSQDRPDTQLDWRVGTGAIRHEFVTLPAEIERGLLGFLLSLGLWQGHFDLIEDPDGRFWFLECNPNGEWLWLDEFVDGALSDWYAEALLEPQPCEGRGPRAAALN